MEHDALIMDNERPGPLDFLKLRSPSVSVLENTVSRVAARQWEIHAWVLICLLWWGYYVGNGRKRSRTHGVRET